jgi:hypothetical protein
LLGDGQHCGQISSQLDPELALLRHQDNRINEPTESVRGFQTAAVGLKRGGELFDLRSVEVGHARMQKRWRFVCRRDLREQRFLPSLKALHLGFQLRTGVPGFDRLDDLLNISFDALQVSFSGRHSRSVLHPKPVHLLRELSAELVEEILAHQFLLKRSEHASLDFLAWNRQFVGARAAIARSEASQVLARVDDEAGSAFAAFRQAREEVLRAPELIETTWIFRRPLPFNRCLPRLRRLPEVVADDAQVRDVLGDPLGWRIQSC